MAVFAPFRSDFIIAHFDVQHDDQRGDQHDEDGQGRRRAELVIAEAEVILEEGDDVGVDVDFCMFWIII